MKKTFFLYFIFLLFSYNLIGQQKNVSGIIKLKDGTSIEMYHFGKLVCESNRYADTYTTLKGKYNQSPTEITNYSDIAELILEGFTAPPMRAAGNQKGSITVVRRNGVRATLEEAELVMSCYGADELFNQIKIQIINPINDKPAEQTIEMREIVSIIFK
jgi:hypothetical protein